MASTAKEIIVAALEQKSGLGTNSVTDNGDTLFVQMGFPPIIGYIFFWRDDHYHFHRAYAIDSDAWNCFGVSAALRTVETKREAK